MTGFFNAKIYKLTSNLSNQIYIGSTTQDLKQRLQLHKSPRNLTVSKKMFENNAIISIHLLESMICTDKNDVKIKELSYIVSNTSAINKNKPFISNYSTVTNLKDWQKEYRTYTLSKMKLYQSIYKNTNEYKIKQKQYISTYNNKKMIMELFKILPFYTTDEMI